MPDKKGRLTAQERVFIEKMAKTSDKTYSAAAAGYKQPSVVGHIVAAKPAIQQEIAAAQTAILFELGLPLAVKTHIAILEDPKTPAGAKVQAVKLMYDRTLGVENQADRKEPHEMSADELSREIERLKREVSDRAKPVVIDEQPVEDVDLFG
jgi:phage terminase small subunit